MSPGLRRGAVQGGRSWRLARPPSKLGSTTARKRTIALTRYHLRRRPRQRSHSQPCGPTPYTKRAEVMIGSWVVARCHEQSKVQTGNWIEKVQTAPVPYKQYIVYIKYIHSPLPYPSPSLLDQYTHHDATPPRLYFDARQAHPNALSLLFTLSLRTTI